MELATLNFAACGRCSYFWAGSQVLVGTEQVATAVAARQEGWLTLPWSQAMSSLIHKSYGVMVDNDFFHFESCCLECRRPFVVFLVTAAEAETAPAESEAATPPSFTIDLEKYDALDDPDFKLPPPTEPPAVPTTFRIRLLIDDQ